MSPGRGAAAIIGAALVALALALVQASGAVAQTRPSSFADLAESVSPAVVNITTSTTVASRSGPMPEVPEGSPFEDFFRDFMDRNGQPQQPRRSQALGSGFVISEDGFIVTNNHVIEGADEINIEFFTGGELTAEVVGTDPKTDIALLKVEADGPLPFVPFGDSDASRVGDWVMAMGNPLGQGFSVSAGIVSARGRALSGTYDDYIQTDAAINRGNSGGPLFNMYGEVIGINTAIISPSGGSIGIGFAVPTELAVNVIDQLREFGETRRGWLGVRIQPVTDEIAESLGMAESKGALVAGVIRGGPVDDGSIEPGDVIIRFDGKEVDNMRDLPRVVAESPVGKAVDVVIIRKGEEQTVKVTLGRLEDSEQQAGLDDGGEDGPGLPDAVTTVDVLGMTLAELDDEGRQEFAIADDVEGVVITAVDPDSAAAEKRIEPGDVIVEIAQEVVATPQDVEERIAALRQDGRRNALLMLAGRTGELRFVTVRMD
jgi:serine protease Do